MPNNLQALLVVFFLVPGFVAAEMHAQQLPLKERSLFDKFVLTVVASVFLHALWMPIWLKANDSFRWIPFPLRADVEVDEGQLWNIWQLAVTYLLPTSIAGAALGQWALPRIIRPRMPVWTVELFQRAREENIAITAYVVMSNGDIYVGVVKSIPHDYEILHGDSKDFSITNAIYLRHNADRLEQLDNQVVLLNTADVGAMHLVPTPLD
jgi:hypothetical protein